MTPDILHQLTQREAEVVMRAVRGLMAQMVDGNFEPRTMAVSIPTAASIETTTPISGFDLRKVADVLHGMNIRTMNPRIEPEVKQPHRNAVKFDVVAYGADQVRVERVDPFQGDWETETLMRDLFRPRQ